MNRHIVSDYLGHPGVRFLQTNPIPLLNERLAILTNRLHVAPYNTVYMHSLAAAAGPAKIRRKFRSATSQTRASAGAIDGVLFRFWNHRALIFNRNWLLDDSITIPVVVGPSPISHPKEFSSKQISLHWLRAFLRLCTRDTQERL